MSLPSQEDAKLEELLADMGRKADAGETEFADPLASAKQPGDRAPEPEKTEKPEEQKPEGEQKSDPKSSDATEADKTKEADKDKTQEETEYSKAKKEQARKEKTWNEINAEKERLRAEREALEKEKSESHTRKKTDSVFRDEHGYSADDYRRAAKKWADEGETQLAAEAEKRAANAEAKAHETQKNEFVTTWQRTAQEVQKENPDLRNLDSPLAVAVDKLLKEEPYFSNVPDGFKRAVDFAKLQIKAESIPSLETKVADLQKEIDRLNKLTQPAGSGPTSNPSTKTFDKMSPAEQEAELLKMARDADRKGEFGE